MSAVRIRLERSESAAEYLSTTTLDRTIELPLDDGPWIQFTYDALRHQDGSDAGISFEDGWIVDEDGSKWSDMVVEFRP